MRKCIFCSTDLPGKKRGKEHILSQHMLDEFQLRKVIVDHSPLAVVKPGFTGGHLSVQSIERSPTFSSFLAGRVCASCNNGWMNDLEKITRPYLYSLIKGDHELREITEKQKHELACWYFKTSVVLSKSVGNEQFIIPQSHCSCIYSNRGAELPSSVSVFTASAKKSDFVWSLCPVWTVQISAELGDIIPEQYKQAYKVFFQLGKIMFLAVYWPHDYRVYTYEDWGIVPIGGKGLCLKISEDCRDFFEDDYLAFMMGVGTLLGLEDQIKKVGRNDVCPCGSSKKYKQCHGRA